MNVPSCSSKPVPAKQWRQDELELKITSMELLPDVKENMIEKITNSHSAECAEQGFDN